MSRIKRGRCVTHQVKLGIGSRDRVLRRVMRDTRLPTDLRQSKAWIAACEEFSVLLVPQQDVRLTRLHGRPLGSMTVRRLRERQRRSKRTYKDLYQAVGQCQRREVLELGFEFGLQPAVGGHALAV